MLFAVNKSPSPSSGCCADVLIQLTLPCYFCPSHVLLLCCVHLIGHRRHCLHNNSFRTLNVQFPGITASCSDFHMQVTNLGEGKGCISSERSEVVPVKACAHVSCSLFTRPGLTQHTTANIQLHYMIVSHLWADLLMPLLL